MLPCLQKNFSCSPIFCPETEKWKQKNSSLFLFLSKTILKISRLHKTSDSYFEEKVIITSHRDVPKPLCCNCMLGKSALFTSGSSSVHLQPDRLCIPSLVTYQMMIHHFIQTFYGREKNVWGKLRGHGKRKDRKIKFKKKVKWKSSCFHFFTLELSSYFPVLIPSQDFSFQILSK